MRPRWAVLCVAALLMGCAQLLDLEWEPAEDGSAGGAGGSQGGAGGQGGGEVCGDGEDDCGDDEDGEDVANGARRKRRRAGSVGAGP